MPIDSIPELATHYLLEFRKLPLLTEFAILSLLILGFLIHLRAYNSKTIHDGPALFTTAGIFFTFLGIAEGLYGFDVSHVEQSVPGLLNGLKTAFFASVAGVGVALSIKIRAITFPPTTTNSEVPESATAEDLLEQLVAIRRSLSSDSGQSLSMQLHQHRVDTGHALQQLHDAFEKFAQRAAENNSKALVDALRSVIADFNEKITEQFGDNFKELNVAVGRLLEWQDKYREQLSELITSQEDSAASLSTAAGFLSKAAENTAAFAEAGAQISELVETLNRQRGDIEVSLTSLGQLLERSASALPDVERHVIELADQMRRGTIECGRLLTDTLSSGTQSMKEAGAEFKTSMLSALQLHNQETNAHLRQVAERLSEQITKLDVALEKELTRSISSLGSQLTSISAKFVDDYAPFIDRIREFSRATRVAAS